MRPQQRTKLTTALREHLAKISAHLRSKMRAAGSGARSG